MKRVMMLCLAGLLAACGSDDDDDGGGATSVAISGAQTLTVTNAISGVSNLSCPATADAPAFAGSVAYIALSNVANACSVLQAGQEKQNTGGALVSIVRFNVIGATPPAVGAGTYPLTRLAATIPTPDSAGNVTIAFAESSRNDAACNETVSAEAVSGTLTITSVSNGAISGSINATLDPSDGGGTIVGNFSAANCAVNIPADVCTGGDSLPDTDQCVP
jgi:hypothetical protein